jgi:vacuolar-type H+-ATPase subunit H
MLYPPHPHFMKVSATVCNTLLAELPETLNAIGVTKPVTALGHSLGGRIAYHMALRNLAGQFEIADGKARLKQPMKLDTPDGPVTLDGYIGLDKALNMKGTFEVTPAMVAQVSGGKLKLGKNAPVGLVLGGTVDAPEVSGVEVGDLVEALLRQSAAGQLIDAAKNAEALAREKAAEAEAMARQKVDAAKAEAQRRVDDAKKKADEAKKKAEAEAKKRADEAKKKAEEEAKKKAKNAIKGLF